MKREESRHTGNIAQVVMQAMVACAMFSCMFVCLGGFAARGDAGGQVLIAAQLCGTALCSVMLSMPPLAEKLTDAERAHPIACGVAIGLVLLASFVGLQTSVILPVRGVLAMAQGATFWLGLSGCVFLADVLELAHPMRTLAVAAAVAAVVSFAVVAAGGGLLAYALLALLGTTTLTAGFAEAAGTPPNSEGKPLVNIFKYFNPRAPIANATSGAIFGVSVAFLVGYGALGPDSAAFAAVGAIAAGFIPRVGNDGAANRAYAVLLALAIGFIVALPLEGKRVASGAVVGLNAFYFLRNVGWAYGQCLKLGSLDTAILSRALAPFLTGTAGGCVVGAALAGASWDAEISSFVGTAMLLLVVVDAVYFMPYLASPYAREAGNEGPDAEGGREHAELAKSLLDDAPANESAEVSAKVTEPDAGLRARCAVVAEEDELTDRELDILYLLCKGRTASYIGDELFISKNTAKVHISHIYNKTGIHSQQELMSYVDSVEAR